MWFWGVKTRQNIVVYLEVMLYRAQSSLHQEAGVSKSEMLMLVSGFFFLPHDTCQV
jgi:hypothetical protein